MMIAGVSRRRPAWSTRRGERPDVCGNESVDLIAHLPWGGEAGAGQGMPGEDGEPDFDLVDPGGVDRGEVKMDVLVAPQPMIVFGLVVFRLSKVTWISRPG